MTTLFQSLGIEIQNTLTGQSAQNGVVKRLPRSLWDKTRTIVNAANLPSQFFDIAMNYVAFMLNRFAGQSFHQKNSLKSPFETFFKQNFSQLTTF